MRLLYPALVVMFIFLFVGGPDYESHRITQHVWDMGHYVLFAGLSFALLNTRFFDNLIWNKKLYFIIGLSFLVGLIVEFIQVFVGRDFEFTDIVSDVLGALMGFLIYGFSVNNISLILKKLMIIVLVVLLFISCTPLLEVLIDEYRMREEFPVIANFESHFQLTRWDVNKANISLSKKNISQGKSSLQVTFLPNAFPDISLQHFLRDWTGYKYISFRLFNPEIKSIDIELKIYDQAHTQNKYKHSDRFNMVIQLRSGWNEIKIPLSEVKNSPIKRKMDLSKIKSLSLFLNNITQPVKLYLSPIELI